MRSWSPPGQRGLEKRKSVDGITYRGRFRIRDVSFSGDNAPSEASVSSICSAPVVGRDVLLDSLDQRSDVSDYSCCLAVSEASEKDDTGKFVEGFRENEAWDRRDCAEQPASLCTGDVGGGSAGDGAENDRSREGCLSVGHKNETSAESESELGRYLLVSPTVVCTTHCKK